MECGLHAPEGDGVSHSRFDKVGQGFALPEYGLKLGAQLWFDADLRYHGGFHRMSVLRLGYFRNEERFQMIPLHYGIQHRFAS